MTLALAIAFNAVLVLALAGTLVAVMSRAARLKPHVSAAAETASEPVVLRQPARPRGVLRPVALADVRG
ncbi:MAG TPA: hypothetical protein VGO14_11475 [Solirubrobacteraceae bacterium]|jgi:hypothetical protein|nr:hypothetical protein [Solirubrobacteraceae bacterium]